jgi:hypothetical protein
MIVEPRDCLEATRGPKFAEEDAAVCWSASFPVTVNSCPETTDDDGINWERYVSHH